jgi:inner membrane protein
VKCQLLFLFLTFVAFYLFELFTSLRIHPVQYLLVGSARCLFYLLLLSLSEHVGFARAYTMASAAVVALIAGYVRAAFGNARAVPIAVMLIVPYARKVDWYQVGRPAPSE